MQPTQLIAVAIGIVFLILIAAVSLIGPRDPGDRRRDNSGAMIPYGDDAHDIH
ncbi:MAG: hypothetical protein R3C25_02890 [Hyphomonadaceae bacterium]